MSTQPTCEDGLSDSHRAAYIELAKSRNPSTLMEAMGTSTFWEAEQLMLERFPSRFQADGAIESPSDLEAIALWKFPISVARIRDLAPETIRSETRAAFERSDPAEKLRTLTRLNGVGPSIATAILMFYDPETYTVMDPNATAGLAQLGCWPHAHESSIDRYEEYCRICRDLAAETGLSLRDVDRALFMLGRD